MPTIKNSKEVIYFNMHKPLSKNAKRMVRQLKNAKKGKGSLSTRYHLYVMSELGKQGVAKELNRQELLEQKIKQKAAMLRAAKEAARKKKR